MVTRVKPRRRLWPLSFGQLWAKMLWDAMTKTGKGYRYPRMRRAKNKRRPDKVKAERLGMTKALRQYKSRYGA